MSASKVIIVTGASRGIGLAAAHWLLKHKHNLVVIARSQGPLDELKAQYEGQVQVLAGDMTDPTIGERAHKLAVDTWKTLDGLILNHGVLDPVSRVASTNVDDWRKCFEINFFCNITMVQACLPTLRKSQGRIVFCSSGASNKAQTGWVAYGTTKAAVNRLAISLGAEEPDVTTVSLRPGMVDTEMQRAIREDHVQHMDAKGHAFFVGHHKEGRLLPPEKPGHVMAQLAVDAPKEISGEFISWDDERLAAFQDK